MINAYVSRPHYYEHLNPITVELALRDEPVQWWAPRQGVVPYVTMVGKPPLDQLVLVASDADARALARHRVVYVEHGAGQSYDGDPRGAGHSSYSGGSQHENVVLFICPSDRVVDRWRAAYPETPAVAVGCPKLDPYLSAACSAVNRPGDQVAISFHWDNPLCAESRSAMPFWRQHLEDAVTALRRSNWRVVGHAHPRAHNDLWRLWRSLDVPYEPDLGVVLRHASVFVADNTSALYEAAAIGTPVVCLNAPWYRKDVHHGLRFWDAVPGPQVDEPADFVPTIQAAFSETRGEQMDRLRAVSAAYAHVDGRASDRAAESIMEVI